MVYGYINKLYSRYTSFFDFRGGNKDFKNRILLINSK